MAAGGAGEDGRIVIDVPHVDDDIGEARQTFAALVCGQDDEAPHGALLAVQCPLGVDLACDLINYEFTLCTLAMERVAQSLLVSILIWVRRRYLTSKAQQDREGDESVITFFCTL